MLPNFNIVFSRNGELSPTDKAIYSDKYFLVKSQYYNNKITVVRADQEVTIIVGNPIVDDEINPYKTAKIILDADVDNSLINGEFLSIHFSEKSKDLCVVNDRFASIPFYFFEYNEHIYGSIFYNSLWNYLKKEVPDVKCNEEAIFEFLWLQRLTGNKTYDNYTKFLESSSEFYYSKNKISIKKYWYPSFEKTNCSLNECAEQLSILLKNSVKNKTSDSGIKLGMFLSGGLDSRIILSSFENPPTCFTFGVTENNESKVAKNVARIVNAPHYFIKLPSDPYSEKINEMVYLGGGMYVFDHSIFYGHSREVQNYANVLFHGHGIDYMFQGMYVPSKPFKIWNKNSPYLKIRRLSQDLVHDFLHNIPFRLKFDLISYIKKEYRSKLYDSLYNSIEQIFSQGKDFCNTPYDFWEYGIIHSLSRHYPNTNLSSIASCAEQRTIVFENSIFDFYLSLPNKHRINSKIARKTLEIMNPELSRLKLANNNFSASDGPFLRTLNLSVDKFARISGIRRNSVYAATAEDRTWPDRGRMFNVNNNLRRHALDMVNSESLSTISFLDMEKINTSIKDWCDKPKKDSGAFMTYLLTLDKFLRQ